MALASWPARPGRKVPAHSKPGLATAEREWSVAGRVAFPPFQNPRPLPGDGWRPAALTLTLGEPAHSSCRVGSARRRGSQRERDQHRGVRTAVPPVAEGTAPVRRTRGAGAFARRSGVWLSLLRHSPARPGTPGRDDARVAVAA